MKKEVLLKVLSEGQTTVQFTKKDGTLRTMNCTRDPKLIPSEYHPKTSEDNATLESSDNIRVFDLENNGWRSFNFSSIK